MFFTRLYYWEMLFDRTNNEIKCLLRGILVVSIISLLVLSTSVFFNVILSDQSDSFWMLQDIKTSAGGIEISSNQIDVNTRFILATLNDVLNAVHEETNVLRKILNQTCIKDSI